MNKLEEKYPNAHFSAKARWSINIGPLKFLILVGLICQGMSTENYFVMCGYCLFWFVLVILKLKRQLLNDTVEFILLLCLLILTYFYSGQNLFEKCMGLGNALALLQVLRLSYRLDYRKKVLSFVIALTQIAIGTQVFLDYTFIIILLFTLILLPKTLFELELIKNNYGINDIAFSFRKHKMEFLLILSVALLFFLFFPRINFEPNSRFYSNINVLRNSVYLSKPELKTSLASVSDETLKNNEVIFQVHAEHLRYLKMITLDKFDGDIWSVSSFGYIRKRDFRKRRNVSGTAYRKIDIKYNKFVSRFLPSDGNVIYLEGNFFDDAMLTRTDNIVIPENINRKNKTYEYWTFIREEAKRISTKEFIRFTRVDAGSERIKQWAEKLTVNCKDDYEKAKTVSNYLKTNFKYELGAPKLDEKMPVEQFLFKDRKGHCERFASALAVVLRTLNIPSLVSVGYLVREKSELGEYYNVRALDAHAWTEAFISGKGWVRLDSTPAADIQLRVRKNDQSTVKKYIDYFEYLWYSKIVNLSYGDQRFVFTWIGNGIKLTGVIISRFFIYILSVVLFIIFVFAAVKASKKNFFKSLKISFHSKKKKRRIEHFYDKMLSILAKHGIQRAENLTPYEFLEIIRAEKLFIIKDVERLTQLFCKMKYGLYSISNSELDEIEEVLNRISKDI